MFFHPMDILIFIALGLAMWAQSKVQNNFHKYARVQASAQITGLQVARRILDQNGLHDVMIERSNRGDLSDHYDPRAKTVRLSGPVYSGSSISSLAIAAHEVGHAIQHGRGYAMLKFRTALFPAAQLGSRMAPLLFLVGFLFFGAGSVLGNQVIGIGIGLFAAAVLFQLVTLPVEYDASRRAKNQLLELGLVTNSEQAGISRVLNAAALTYVASTLMAVLQLLKFIMIFGRRR
ncbi:zinc metallopeptidase [Amphibacillus cookii]|uniref:zinc metallopeptidase n=1 Tax=Amphibacillus cookii TaxID=767787 RepID=UPI00195A4B1E|nr:zinc metallopeptidase [Amphibacillus cookii]MBM7541612.1 Zn-dependent membrane protease YugP [Amphibacillus cookii]